MIVLGVTGSIGMGKTTTARLFAEAGAVVHDADAVVHALYDKGGAAAAALEDAFPGVAPGGVVDRERLGARVLHDPEALERLEAVIHPLVAADRAEFLARARQKGAAVAVLDVPLLFETGGDRDVDAVVVASAAPDVQRERVLVRSGMTPEKLAAILARQIPDSEKRARADFVVDTGLGLEAAREQVKRIMTEVTRPGWRRPQ